MARVIISNSDFIAGRLVNWIFTESDIRVNLLLTVSVGEIPVETIKEQVKAKLRSYEEVDADIPVKVHTQVINTR